MTVAEELRVLALLPETIRKRIVVSQECWEWTGCHKSPGGYGYIRWRGRGQSVHRVVYEILNGPKPGMDIDHLCGRPSCCNPRHLEAVTHQVNIKRGRAGSKMACNYGHDWNDPRNVRVRKGIRDCRECKRQREREKYRLSKLAPEKE